jgi:uncharacterized membrane protein YkoI
MPPGLFLFLFARRCVMIRPHLAGRVGIFGQQQEPSMSVSTISSRVREATAVKTRRGRRRRTTALVRPVVEHLEGRLLLTGRPPVNTGTGFYVVGRNIYDANGNPFVIRGINTWGNTSTDFAILSEIPKTQANTIRVVFGPTSSPAQRQAVVAKVISEGLVPIVVDDATNNTTDLGSLNAVVDRWLDPANVQWLKQDARYVILDIASEWGPADYTWAQGYESAIARIRAAGINCLLMIDAGVYGRTIDDFLAWGQQVLNSDPQANVVYDVHPYVEWATEGDANLVGTVDGRTPYDMATELQKVAAENLPLVVGELTWSPSRLVSDYSTQRALQIIEGLGMGWVVWAWNDSDGMGLIASGGYQYTSDADLTPFGDLIVNDPNYGLRATSRRASVFPPGVDVTPTSGLETTQAGGTSRFTVSLNSPPASDVTIPLSSSDKTEGTVSPASLTFTPADWNVPQTVTVTGVNDGIDQGNVAYTIVPGAPTSQDPNYNGLVASDVAVTNIDTDGPVQIADNGHAGWSDVGPWYPGGPGSGYGGDSNSISAGIGTNTATWTFAVAPGLYRIATNWVPSSGVADNAPYTILNNGANLGFLRVDQQVAPNDFSADGANWKDLGTFVVSGGTLQVQLSDDADGNVIADAVQIDRLSNTIVNVAASPASVPEDSTTGLVYTFTRAGATSSALTVSFGVGGTAVLGTNYTEAGAATFGASSGTVTFAPGSATATVTVTPIADSDSGVEGDQSVILTIAPGSGYAPGSTSSSTGIISDDNTNMRVTVAASPASVPEDSTTGVVYTFTRAGATSGALTVAFGVGGTAAFGTDYTESGAASFGASSGTVTFAPGSATASVTIMPMVNNDVDESNQSVILTVAAGGAYGIGSPNSATTVITDVQVTVAVSPAAVAEDGAAGLVYTFTRTDSAAALTVSFGVGGTAVLGTDFTESGAASFGASSGTVTFAPGSTTTTVTLLPIADSQPDPNETAVLTVSDGVGYALVSPRVATGTITDSHVFVDLSCFPTWVAKDSVDNLVYTFSRAGSTAGALTVGFTVGGTAVFGTDYTESGAASFGATAGTVTFAPGSATATVTLAPTADSAVEPDETAVLTVSAGSGYTVGAYSSTTGIITDTTATVSVVVSPAAVPEDGTAGLVYTFTRAGSIGGPLTVNFAVGGAAAVGTDYTAVGAASFGTSAGTVTFAPGSAAATVTIVPLLEKAVEADETVILSVLPGVGALVGPVGSATGTITNDYISPNARFLARDATTQGNWIGAYGSQGYDIAGAAPALPSFAGVSLTGASTYVWAASTTDPRALQSPGGTGRSANGWYGGTFTIDLNLTGGQVHDLALYAVDWDNGGRQERIQVVDPATGNVLDTEVLSSFRAGAYLQWAVSGHVQIRVTQLAGINAVVSGLFFDAASATAALVRRDATTQGNWVGAYGSLGYDVAGATPNLPPSAGLSVPGAATWTWAASTTDPRALQSPGGTGRSASTWYGNFTIDVITDAQLYDLALYAVDWDNQGRREQIQAIDAATGKVLDTEVLSSFSGGAYLQWAVSGHVQIRVTRLAGPNAVISGLFLDAASATAVLVRRDMTTQGNWVGAYGSQGYDIAGTTPSLPPYAAFGLSGAATYTWVASTTDPRALQSPGGTGRSATGWYGSSFTIDLNLADARAHELALYAVNWDNQGRQEQVQVIDAASGKVLDTETLSSFPTGVYLQWAVFGHVQIRVTRLAGPNAVISGLFLDAPPA